MRLRSCIQGAFALKLSGRDWRAFAFDEKPCHDDLLRSKKVQKGPKMMRKWEWLNA
jgi:hypothetical protein